MEALSTKSRNIIAIKNDIARLEAIIEKRFMWLEDATNRKRSTWIAVYKDTRELAEQLQELRDELNQAINH